MPDLGEPGRPGPFSLADPDRVRSILEGAGFTVVGVDECRCPMPMGATVEDTVAFMQGTDMAQTLMADVSEDVAGAAWDVVRAALVPYAGREGSCWVARRGSSPRRSPHDVRAHSWVSRSTTRLASASRYSPASGLAVMASMTQWRRCWSTRPRAIFCRAALTDAIWVRMSMQ